MGDALCGGMVISTGRKKSLSTPINAGPYAVVRATHWSTASRISVASDLPESQKDSSLCVPLIAQGEAIGLLSFQNITPETAPSRAYLELMAEALGLALANQRLRDALLEKALFDPLTGLRNRHHLEDTLRTQIAQAMRNDEPVSCMMIDIDHFKSINDRFGHEAGDHVIKSVATIVQRAVHNAGLAFRFGGEEFLVLLTGADEEAAHACATEIYNGVHTPARCAMGLLRLAQWMCRSGSPVTRSTPKATTCCARQTWRFTGRKSWGARGSSVSVCWRRVNRNSVQMTSEVRALSYSLTLRVRYHSLYK